MLPGLAGIVPMEAKLGQNASDGGGLLVCELNPNPLANNLSNIKKARCFATEQRQQLLGVKRAIRPPEGEVDLRSVFRFLNGVRLFGLALEPGFLIFLCIGFHGLFLCSAVRFGLSPFNQKDRAARRPVGVIFRGYRVRPPAKSGW